MACQAALSRSHDVFDIGRLEAMKVQAEPDSTTFLYPTGLIASSMGEVVELRGPHYVHPTGFYKSSMGLSAKDFLVEMLGQKPRGLGQRILIAHSGGGALAKGLRERGYLAFSAETSVSLEQAQSGNYLLAEPTWSIAKDLSFDIIIAWYGPVNRILDMGATELTQILNEYERILYPGSKVIIGPFPTDEASQVENRIKLFPRWKVKPSREFKTGQDKLKVVELVSPLSPR